MPSRCYRRREHAPATGGEVGGAVLSYLRNCSIAAGMELVVVFELVAIPEVTTGSESKTASLFSVAALLTGSGLQSPKLLAIEPLGRWSLVSDSPAISCRQFQSHWNRQRLRLGSEITLTEIGFLDLFFVLMGFQ